MLCLEKHLEDVLKAHKEIVAPYTINYFGGNYLVNPNVFSPILTASTTTIMRSMIKRKNSFKGKAILDMGCGCGVLAINALKLGSQEILAVDMSTSAIENTIENTKHTEGGNNIEIIESDLFTKIPLNRTFDIILANLPLVDRKSTSELEKAFFDKGYRTIKKFLSNVSERLTFDGKVFLNCASIANIPQIVNWAIENGLLLEEVDLFDDYIFDHYVFIFRKS